MFQSIPQVEKLLQTKEIAGFVPKIGRVAVADIIRGACAELRTRIGKGEAANIESLVPSIVAQCSMKLTHRLQRVINGTGVVIHTNLGRTPVSEEILQGLAAEMSGYCNLEYDLTNEKRGARGSFTEELLCTATGAQDCLVVNNNAASVYIILAEFCRGREVIVSRSELIQIGGGFRLPDIMRESGALLVEVGTTNITLIDDFRAAITEKTAMIFSSHQSNFRIQGFTQAPALKELTGLKNETILFVRDLGSGNLAGDRLGLDSDPTPAWELDQGADLVCFSGDKLLGGCQAGIIAGRKELVSRLRRNPLMRMLRVDKFTFFMLQETLLKFTNGTIEDVSLWRMMLQDINQISGRIKKFIGLMKSPAKADIVQRVSTRSVIGGGAMPGFDRESRGVRIVIPGRKAEETFADFTTAAVPVIGTIIDGCYTLDFFTIFGRDIRTLAAAADEIIARHTGKG